MSRLRPWIAALLHTWADRIDPNSAIVRTGLSFTFEDVAGGILLRTDGLGCPLYRIGAGDLRRAHDESNALNPHADEWDAAVVETVRLETGESAAA